jgi:hypothetical protein
MTAIATSDDSASVAWPEFTWSSSDTSVIAIDATGLAVPIGLGRAVIAAEFDGYRDEVTVDVVVPRVDGGVSFASLARGSSAHCALTAAGRVYCLEVDEDGVQSLVPLPGSADVALTEFHVAPTHRCGITADGALKCWGSNTAGEFLTSALSPPASNDAPFAGGGARRFSSISVGSSNTAQGATCGIDRADQRVYCGGRNQIGVLGRESDLIDGAVGPMDDVVAPRQISISGGTYGCLRTALGAIQCWGAVPNGGVSGTGSATPWIGRAIAGPALDVISTSPSHACGLDASNAAWCWGRNREGQLGLETTDASSHPTILEVETTERFRMISAAEGYTCGIALNGSLWCWGNFPSPAFSNHYADRRGTPIELIRNLDFVSLSTTASSVCAMTAAGRVHCF